MPTPWSSLSHHTRQGSRHACSCHQLPLFLTSLHACRCVTAAIVAWARRLVSPDILRLVHPGARMVYVGKEAGLHTRSQEQIHAMLCALAAEGATVLRLKGGDPFMFGRGGEEAAYLRERGIRVHTVPGAAVACCLGAAVLHYSCAAAAWCACCLPKCISAMPLPEFQFVFTRCKKAHKIMVICL